MTLGGWIFLIIAWGLVGGVTVFVVIKLLKGSK